MTLEETFYWNIINRVIRIKDSLFLLINTGVKKVKDLQKTDDVYKLLQKVNVFFNNMPYSDNDDCF